MKPRNAYPDNWKEIADQIKADAGWCCIRCHHPHDPENGYTLTVHHLDMVKSNCEWWNLVALCQRCHLSIQARVDMKKIFMFEHTHWFRPYVAGYYANLRGLPSDKHYVMAHLEDLLDIKKLPG